MVDFYEFWPESKWTAYTPGSTDKYKKFKCFLNFHNLAV